MSSPEQPSLVRKSEGRSSSMAAEGRRTEVLLMSASRNLQFVESLDVTSSLLYLILPINYNIDILLN